MSRISEILNQRSKEIWSVRSDQPVLDAIRLMAEKGIGALLVMDGSRLVGVLSERDYARKVILENRSSKNTLVREIMTSDVVTVSPESEISECMSIMTENDFRHLPVVQGDEVVSMISIGDLVKVVIKEQQFTIDQLEHYITG